MAETVYQIDANGVPIKPGYRPPFQKGYDPRRGRGPKLGMKYVTLEHASRLLAKLDAILNQSNMRKRGSRVVLQKLERGKNVVKTPPISSVISPTVQPISRPAPTVKPASPISPCSIRQPAPVDDYDGLF